MVSDGVKMSVGKVGQVGITVLPNGGSITNASVFIEGGISLGVRRKAFDRALGAAEKVLPFSVTSADRPKEGLNFGLNMTLPFMKIDLGAPSKFQPGWTPPREWFEGGLELKFVIGK